MGKIPFALSFLFEKYFFSLEARVSKFSSP